MAFTIVSQPRLRSAQSEYLLAKRLLDIVLCLIALPLALPLLLICAIAIHLDSPGPIFYNQERIGKGGRPFPMYKFRTMKHDLDRSYSQDFMRAYVKGEIRCTGADRSVFKPVRAGEVTRVGRILRKTSLDELPQLLNVLHGDMSIVGPRPNVPWEVEAYRPWHYERLEVLPGITGLAQVHGRSCLEFDSIVTYDIAYIAKCSLGLDLKILWWTFVATVLGHGAG